MSLTAKLTPLFSARLGLLDEQVSVGDAEAELNRAAVRAGYKGSSAPVAGIRPEGGSHRSLLDTMQRVAQIERSIHELQRDASGSSR